MVSFSRGYEWGVLIIKLFYRGGSSYYLLRGSVNHIPMETGISTVIHMWFSREGLGSDPLPPPLNPSMYSDI